MAVEKKWQVLLNCIISTFIIVSCYTSHASTPNDHYENTKLLVTFVNQKTFPLHRAGSGFKTYANQRYRVSPNLKKVIKHIGDEYRLREVNAWNIKPLNIYCVVYELDGSQKLKAALSALNADPRIETAQPMHQFSTQSLATETYDDPYLNLQHAWLKINLPQAHEKSTGKGVKIAIIDTAIDSSHDDIKQSIIHSQSYTPKEFNSSTKKQTHGTAIAGIIAATANNQVGIVGVAPESHLLALEACWYQQNTSSYAVCNSFTLAQALSTAIEQQVDIINLSLAGPNDLLLKRIINKAITNNILVVAARGSNEQHNFPASVEGVIAVADAESYPITEKNWIKNLVLAPGKNIISTSSNNGYDFFSGNSIATAQVSGILALTKGKSNIQSVNVSNKHLQGLTDICKLLNPIISSVAAIKNCMGLIQTSNLISL